ncbi:MAG: type I 3-dehydroquinate dehydratase [Candidatus Bathyarchaeota archaeon]
MTIRVCISLPPKTFDECVDLIRKAEAQNADFIEIRLDYLDDYGRINKIPSQSKIPLIATNKSIKQHGAFSGTESDRQKILIEAAKKGFDYVDIDLGTRNQTKLISNLHKYGTRVIVSFHDFKKTPSLSELNNILNEMLFLQADVCKIITTAQSMKDNLLALNFVSDASKKTKIVCFAMGEFGKHSRLVSPLFGAYFTFASLDEKRKTAEGQLTLKEMNLAYETLGIK